MDILEAIRLRKSIRGYKPDPVPREILREILEVATRAPSAVNSQPWEFTVVTGQVLDDIKRGIAEKLAAGVQPQPDFPAKAFDGVFRERQIALAQQIWALLGISREDHSRRAEWRQMGYLFYDAPTAIFISCDESLGEVPAQLDIGIVTQTICLTAMAYGLGTCIERQTMHYPDVIRKHTSLPQSKKLAIAIAIGYPDWNFPANKLESPREPVDHIITWCGFN